MRHKEVYYRTNSQKNFIVTLRKKHEKEINDLNPNKIALLFTPEYEGIFKNGGIGTYYKTLSEYFNQQGWYVILIIIFGDQKFYGTSNISSIKKIFNLSEAEEALNLQTTHKATLSTVCHDVIDHESFRALFFTQAFVNTYRNSLIYAEFPEYLGVGYRTIQGKESKVLKDNCVIGVTLHSCHEWLDEANQKYVPDSPSYFLRICHYEQYCFENADLSFFPSHFLIDKIKSYGWLVEQSIHLPYFIPIINSNYVSVVQTKNNQKNKKIVNVEKVSLIFFGRLEERKGFLTFIKALEYLSDQSKKKLHIFFIGKVVKLKTYSVSHLNSQEYIQSKNIGIEYTILEQFYSQEAIQFVSNCLNPIVCLASSQENFPNAALEMGQLPINLVVSNTGGFRETLNLIDRNSGIHWFESKNSLNLANTIEKVLKKLDTGSYSINVPGSTMLKKINQGIIDRKIDYIIQKSDLYPNRDKVNTTSYPTVTIGITCYNLGEYLMECLTSVEAQTYPHIEVLVLDDASTDEYTQDIIHKAKEIFPKFTFTEFQTNVGLGEARNYLVEQAKGEYFLPLDADNILLPFAIEHFVEAAIYSQAKIVACKKKDFGESYGEVNFLGGPLPLLLQENICGDACSLFLTEFLREFRHAKNRDVCTHDWEIMTAAYITGKKIVYYPYHLYEYRIRKESMIRGTFFAKEQYYLRQYLAKISPKEWKERQIYMLIMSSQLMAQQLSYVWETQSQHQNINNAGNVYEELKQVKMRIEAMESSKFWKLRKVWFKVKRFFGYGNNE